MLYLVTFRRDDASEFRGDSRAKPASEAAADAINKDLQRCSIALHPFRWSVVLRNLDFDGYSISAEALSPLDRDELHNMLATAPAVGFRGTISVNELPLEFRSLVQLN